MDCRDTPTIIYDDDKPVAFFNMSDGEVIMEVLSYDPFTNEREAREWVRRKYTT